MVLSNYMSMQKDHTHHQLRADAPFHSDMLPAAALSNFFKAPATPIHRLPAIHPVKSCQDPHFSKSLHQRNRGLAEVIQMQLVELKKLHGKYGARDMPAMSRAHQIQSLSRHSAGYTECVLPRVNNQKSLLSRRYNSTTSIIPSPKQETLENRDTTVSVTTSQQAQSKASTYTAASMRVSQTGSTPNISSPNVQNRTILDKQPDKQPDERPDTQTHTSNTSPIRVSLTPPNPILFNHLGQDKFDAIQQWIHSVEEAHEKDGKYLNTTTLAS